MAYPRVVSKGDGLQLSCVAANMLNKHSWTADKGWSPVWELDGELTATCGKKPAF
jgi:hypothetical protein